MYGRNKNEASKDSNLKYKDESTKENVKGNERRDREEREYSADTEWRGMKKNRIDRLDMDRSVEICRDRLIREQEEKRQDVGGKYEDLHLVNSVWYKFVVRCLF